MSFLLSSSSSRQPLFFALALLGLSSLGSSILGGCSAGTGDASGGAGVGGDSTSSSGFTTSDSSSSSDPSTTGGFMTTSTGEGGGTSGPAEVFGHSAIELYKLDPDTKVVTTVGQFDGCGSEVIDIALDKDSNLYATSTDGLYSVDRTTAKCTEIAEGDYPNSLSFVPAGTLDPSSEVLVGYSGSQYERIDTKTGQVTPIGSGLSGTMTSSGDIVSVKGGATYLTVTDISQCSESDCLIEVNPVTGAMIKNWGPLGYSAVYGIAFWAGSVYGFDAAGQLFEVKFTNNQLSTSLVNSPPGVSFYGAGSTTSAPPVPQ